jgi:GNAT superfamily N-acetyltransferase
MKTKPASLVVQALGNRHKGRILRHFLSLSDADRSLRFGNALSDEALAEYVAKLDCKQDALFGLSKIRGPLLALAHLALRQAEPGRRAQAELGLSVLAKERGQGLGSRLFSHALDYCLKLKIDAFYMHCLASNQTMLHIARQAGMEIVSQQGESDAYLQLTRPQDRCAAA